MNMAQMMMSLIMVIVVSASIMMQVRKCKAYISSFLG